ncbi:MAG: NAD-dependent dihydropyrimidine dehydrogenase subunit PreA [Planctomycetota bacterium]|jgi:dihydropyrimidine dehydrogenase (NAD+) subunit PreA
MFEAQNKEIETMDLSTEFCGIRLRNPYLLAASPCTDDEEMVRNAFEAGWAGAVLKTTSVPGQEVSLVYPMMSGVDHQGKRLMGMGNIDLISEHHVDVVEKRIASLKSDYPDHAVIASIMGASKNDWQTLVERLEEAGADAIECSFSCPQGTLGSKPGRMLGQDAGLSHTVTEWVKKAAKSIPVIIKITPQVTDVVEVARAVKGGGADALCAANSVPALMGIELETGCAIPSVGGRSTFSGYSGPAIKPLTLRTLALIAQGVDLPIAATGGPVTWRDAVEMMMVGATCVQFCTAVMHHGFRIVEDLVEGLEFFLQQRGWDHPSDLRGVALPTLGGHEALPRDRKVRAKVREDLCAGCGSCVVACADGGHGAAGLGEDGKAKVDESRCLGCALCETICTMGAIRVEPAE